MNVSDILLRAAKTFAEKRPVYGDNWKKVGAALAGMFPDGLTVRTSEDWQRLYLLILIVMKLSRYSNNFLSGGHPDSAHDMMVYSAMIEALDEEFNNGRP